MCNTFLLRVNLPISVSIILALIILKGIKNTLFNFKITAMCMLRFKNKYKENLLGKTVNILLELNFTIFIIICHLGLINCAPYIFEINIKSILLGFLTIYIIQFIKKSLFSRKYSNVFLT